MATLGLLISASIVFAQLHNTLNIIFDVNSPNFDNLSKWQMLGGFIKTRLFSMGFLIILIAIITVSLLVPAAIPLFSTIQSSVWLTSVNYVVSFAVFTILFGIIFRWMPDCKIEIKNALLGGALTSFLFIIGNIFIGLYLTKSGIGSPFGAAGSFMVTLAWVYYSSLVVFVGAEITYFSLVQNVSAMDPTKVIKPVTQQAMPKA
jgi:membrane protein